MNATATPTARRKTARKNRPAPARPVTATLLELAYYLHTTRVVGSRSASTR